MSDEELVTRCKAELPKVLTAYNELVRRHRPLVFNTCVRVIGSRLDAEEICQDSFLRVFHKIGQFEGRSTFKTWLFRIVLNMCLSRRGSLAKRRERDHDYGDHLVGAMNADLADAGTAELAERIEKAMSRLNEQNRRIVTMKFVTGLRIEEIAEELNLKLSATKMRLYRARDELRAAYADITGGNLAA